MSTRTRTRKTPVETMHPMDAAYAVAHELAAAAVQALLLHDGSSTSRDTNINAVYETLATRQRGGDPAAAVQALIEQHITNRAVSVAMADLVTSTFVDASEAGYAYGLAVGLALAKMGAR